MAKRKREKDENQSEDRGEEEEEEEEEEEKNGLRHRLSKQRRVNGLRSFISHEHAHDTHVDERNYRGSSRRDSHQMPQHEGPLSSRLRGRIKLPGGSSVNGGEFDRGRSRGRLSPSRPQSSIHQGRLREEAGDVQAAGVAAEEGVFGCRRRWRDNGGGGGGSAVFGD
ncbi:hypothetical protein L484_005715 [Morus notabilis]|uniref:Uncharacterized protein n=1 Tax=Morus notabilis TaxID=981085 RepID=W9QIS2_9ROSA|nr:hypothetical protein L484_005715 [Morus notabilis]